MWPGLFVQGDQLHKIEQPKAALYQELLPRLCSAEIELLDNEQLIDQIASLERRTRSGGKDIVDYPPGGRDDLANAVAGVAACLGQNRATIGGWNLDTDKTFNPFSHYASF